ncbi:SAM-dependent methyltransferase [Legionella waltersii]|uniref:SAM-dependent methyltransferase n=1 Tax=Legionella waltersii TaxID=66969 RepID=A0A0W1ADD3_9GAMM|nr:SAM-dependent methyltransferase [Legionella waltersii]KTD79356.1 SAM-dependent methyltransferase [Legionella waltersii]SNU99885.1 SAM-dependent methyltransferase [Legionella waltersii]
MFSIQHTATIYRGKPEFLKELCEEMSESSLIIEDLVFSPLKKEDLCFALDVWLEPQMVHFESISQAVKILRQAGKFWYLHPIKHIRRSKLIEEQLRKVPSLTRAFPVIEEIPKLGVFSLLDQNTLVYSAHRSKQWPDGNCFFTEDKITPPNRAYLKLWEALFLLNQYPKPDETVLDLGASPGGWTYVMQSFGAHVTSVDKAELAPKIMALPNISFRQQSAFALEPEKLSKPYDWVLSDIACYPDRAYSLITRWINSGKAKRLIFTIKLQGQTNMNIIRQLKEIPNSRVQHLFYNKHEVTFFYPSH